MTGPAHLHERAEERREMVAIIVAKTFEIADELGKNRLDARVLDAMATVPRHAFVPDAYQSLAHADRPAPIGCGKTISQPFIVALMTDLLDLRPHHRALEIGTGLGYQTAILARLADRVYSVERIGALAAEARRRFDALGIDNIESRTGNGFLGWPEHAPFDRIMVTGAPESVPPALVTQLRPGGRLVLPAGPAAAQQLIVVDKDDDGGLHSRHVLPVRFSALEDRPAE
jgi:protein-L-isoaspartate(D-aspartate) O-methyltransferase